jgi:cytochrome c-type biogenesis protein
VSLDALFAFLTHALEGHAALALGAAVAWGAVSVLLSPCHLATVPLLIGYISSQSDVTPRRAFTISILFALGLLATIAVVGVGTAAAGRVAGDLGGYANYVVAAVCLVAGLYLLDLLPASVACWTEPRWAGRGKGAALVLGLVVGTVLGPCTFAYMAPLLAVAFRLGATDLAFGLLLLAAFGVGHCALIAVAGTSTGWVQRWLTWHGRSRAATALKQAAAVLVLAAGVYLVYSA